MISRDQWGEIYDWARYNGFSPVDFISQAMANRTVPQFSVLGYTGDEEAIYEACRQFSISRTQYPSTLT